MLNLGFLGVEYLLLGNCANVSIASRIIVLLDHGHEAASGFCAAEVKHALVHVVHVLLLRAKDRAWARDTNPTDKCGRWEAEMLHAIESDKGSSAPKSSLAVNGNGARLVFGGS